MLIELAKNIDYTGSEHYKPNNEHIIILNIIFTVCGTQSDVCRVEVYKMLRHRSGSLANHASVPGKVTNVLYQQVIMNHVLA